MKRNLTAALTAILILTLFLSIGCGKGNVTPSPTAALTPVTTSKLTPMLTISPAPIVSPAGSPGTSPATSPGGTIQGFVEGGIVDPTKVPKVVDAVKKEYPNDAIKSITYVIHNTQQAYEVTLEGKTEPIYVDAEGKVIK